MPDRAAVGAEAARIGAQAIRDAIAERGEATVVVATGASQLPLYEALAREAEIDWRRVAAFHLDEYIDLPLDHPASFRRYLRERFLAPLGSGPRLVEIDGEAADPEAEARRLNGLIANRRVDVCFAGIGENCHLAFNDPPADFETEDPFIVVELDEACRRQQFGEGWFETLEAVPRRAISMSVRQILKAERLLVSVPEARKARAVRDAVEREPAPERPASILQTHSACDLLLDPDSSALLNDGAKR